MKRSYSDLDAHQAAQEEAPAFSGHRAARQSAKPQLPGDATQSKIKMCTQCGTTRTPQWREGPLGPKTLCNACGVKRVRALKAMHQGKGHSPHGKKAAHRQTAAARTESVELATTLQLLAGRVDAGPPPAKRQARAAHSAGGSSGRSKRAAGLLATQQQTAAHDGSSYLLTTAGPGTAAHLTAVQKALAAMAKGSIGGESNPTDSGEEISWSPNDHQEAGAAADESGRPPLSAAAVAARKQQRQQQIQRAAAAAEQANARLAAVLGAAGGAAAAAASGEMPQEAADEADAAANLLSMSVSEPMQQHEMAAAVAAGGSGAVSKAAIRDFVAALSAGAAAGAGRSRQPTPPRHVVTVRQRTQAGILKEDDLLYLMGPGMAVLARHVGPEQMLEVVRLNEVLAEAQRGAAAAEAAVAAVDKILREKRAAAEAATANAIAAARQLHYFVSDLNSQHGLMQRAAQAAVAQAKAAAQAAVQAQQQYDATGYGSALGTAANVARAAAGSSRGGGFAAGSRVGSQQHLDLLATAMQPHVKEEPAAAELDQHQQQQQSAEANPALSPAVVNHHQQQQPAAGSSALPAVAGDEGVCLSTSGLDGGPGAAAADAADVGPDDANAEVLEAAALLGSLHDLAAAQQQYCGNPPGDAAQL